MTLVLVGKDLYLKRRSILIIVCPPYKAIALQKATDFRFLTGLNAKTRDFINSLSLPNLSSSLLAETEFVSSSSSVFGTNQSTAIGHDGVVEKSSVSTQESFDFFAAEESTFKISPDHDRKIQLDSSEFSLPQDSVGQVSTFEVGTRQIGFPEYDSLEIGTSQIGIGQIGTSQTHEGQISSFENGIAEISSHRPRTVQNSSRKIGVSQVSFNETNRRQISSSQISSFEIDSSKVSFSSSIPFEQFFSFHNSSPKIINVLNNTATNIWSDLLQPQTKLDINFQIIDFDDSGKSNAGTILIDHDANGIGWFIVKTLLGNSEFTAQNTDSFLIAATESEADGKYDLLTTILYH